MFMMPIVQDHVHDADDVGEGFLLLAVEGALLKRLEVLGRKPRLVEIVVRFAQEARRAAGAVVDSLTDGRLNDPDHGADQRARRVVLAAVAPGVAHVPDLGFVEMRQLVLFGLRAEAQGVDGLDDFAQVVPAGDLVFDLAEDLADLVFDRVRPGGLLLEAGQVGKQLVVDEVGQIAADLRPVNVELAVLALGRGPILPAIGCRENRRVLLSGQCGFRRFVLLESFQILQEQQPGCLLGVIELGGAASLFPEDVVDVLERLLEHGSALSQNHRCVAKRRRQFGARCGNNSPCG
jgi:hypothetical protein